MLDIGLQEYIFTIGIVASFIGLVVAAVASRKSIAGALRGVHVTRRHVAVAAVIALLFLGLELAVVRPTQQLFFDDAIYQGGAQDLLAMGQAWMCNYGTPAQCFSGQIFHEPVGTSFNLAIGFAMGGIGRATAFSEFIIIATLAVFLTFLAAMLLFRDWRAAMFSELLMALSPMLLIWAAPTTSDLLMMFYSVVAVFAMLVFARRKSPGTLAFALFSLAFLAYMKVNALAYIALVPVMFLLLDSDSVRSSIRENLSRARRNLLNTKVLVLVLVFILCVLPMVLYTTSESAIDTYGYQGTNVQLTCGTGYITATSTINLQNFGANICSNIMFWFNSYASLQQGYTIAQPVLFTLLALLGLALLIAMRRRESAALFLWFALFFAIYTAFYAGSVLFGVDWRFMLAVLPAASMLGGFGAGSIVGFFRRYGRRIVTIAAYAVVIAAMLYSTLSLYGYMSISPGRISQAGDARLYENFVYNNSYRIPESCLVFSFDPTLFNINGRASRQLGDISGIETAQQYANYSDRYGCLAIDYGFWCYTTPGMSAMCSSAMNSFRTETIATERSNISGNLYGLYRITALNAG